MSGGVVGAIEGGGTKFLCAVGRDHEDVIESTRIPTTDPDTTLSAVVAFFAGHDIDILGLAMFGPVDLRDGPGRGTMLQTPKPGWSGVPVRRRLEESLGVPVAVDTDVNGAALAEHRWGAACNADPVLYLTVGTGVGGGVVVGDRPVHGLMHPEVGHLPVPRLDGDDFGGACPFHGRCLEGVASGTALRARLGEPADDLPDDDPLWTLSGRYVGHALASAVLVLSPQRIVVGGGVSARPPFLPAVREALVAALAGYVPRPELADGIDRYVVPPGLDGRSGLAGAFALTQ